MNNYLGNVEVHIYNENDVEVISYYNSIFWFGQCSIGIQSLVAGFYRLEIILDN